MNIITNSLIDMIDADEMTDGASASVTLVITSSGVSVGQCRYQYGLLMFVSSGD